MVEPRWEFFPLLAEQEQPRKWLQIQADLSLAENTIQAYGKSLEDYLLFCKIYKVIPETAKKADIAIYVRYLSNRPNPRGKNIISLDSGDEEFAVTEGIEALVELGINRDTINKVSLN